MKSFYGLFILFAFFLCSNNRLYGQGQISVTAGLGFPELLNIGVHFSSKQIQIGFFGGFWPTKKENLMTLGGDFYYHFGGFSELSERKPWYGRAGFIFYREETDTFIAKYVFLDLRVGREINITKRFGIQPDIGATIQLSHSEIRKAPTSGWFDGSWEFPVLPSMGLTLIYRL